MPDTKQSPDGPASAPAAEPETLSAILAEMREISVTDWANLTPRLVHELADRIEAAVEREREETKDYFAKLHDGPSMICTAKNCSLRNAAEDIVEQVKAEASFGHFAPVVAEDRPVGNAAALREALVEILDRTNREKARDYDAALNCGILEIHDIANTAIDETKGE